MNMHISTLGYVSALAFSTQHITDHVTANLLTGAKHPAFSTDHLADIN